MVHDVIPVRFLASASNVRNCPSHDFPEVAVAGRSNCGKSTLINALVGQRQLARVSRTPGRTQLINFFVVAERLVLVDLPGYGYADVPLSLRAAWGPMIEGYLTERPQLRGLLLLLDARREPGDEEHNLCAWCEQRHLPVLHVATKLDKLSLSAQKPRLMRHAADYGVKDRDVLGFSAKLRDRRAPLWEAIERVAGVSQEASRE